MPSAEQPARDIEPYAPVRPVMRLVHIRSLLAVYLMAIYEVLYLKFARVAGAAFGGRMK